MLNKANIQREKYLKYLYFELIYFNLKDGMWGSHVFLIDYQPAIAIYISEELILVF